MTNAVVEITDQGRSGTAIYREGDASAAFEWELALSPTLAYVYGIAARDWDEAYPWARGRQEEIYDFVAGEIVRQRAPGHRWVIDLAEGLIRVLHSPQAGAPLAFVAPASTGPEEAVAPRAAPAVPVPPAPGSPAFARFKASAIPDWAAWPEGGTYDLHALADIDPSERDQAVTLLTSRTVTWREVDALALIETPAAQRAIAVGLGDRMSSDTRLAALEAMQRQGRLTDFEERLAREIRCFDQPTAGLARALRLAAESPSARIRQALLWASVNATACAPSFAGLLLTLTGAAREPFEPEIREMLARLDVHNTAAARAAAFDSLCRRAGMVLDPDAGR